MTTLDGGVIIKKGGGGTSPAPMPSAPIAENDVTFYDYDGTVLYAYTKEEFLALTAMPPLPTRERLICQEWNWTWEEAYDYVSKYGICMIGATYTTDDGATRVTFDFTSPARLTQQALMTFSVNEGGVVELDWGDGSPIETYSEGSYLESFHFYKERRTYTATIKPISGTFKLAWIYDCGPLITEINFGENCTIDSYGLNDMSALRAVTFPKSFTGGSSLLHLNVNLQCIVIPTADTLKNIYGNILGLKILCFPSSIKTLPASSGNGFGDLLTRFVIPAGVTEIPSGYFKNTYLYEVGIPKSVITIRDYAFDNAYYIFHIDLSQHEQIPTLGKTVFYNTTKIIVPDNLYDAWIAATNWSAIAGQIIKKSDWDALNA